MMDEQFLRQTTNLEEAAALPWQLVAIRSYPGGAGDANLKAGRERLGIGQMTHANNDICPYPAW